MPIFEFTCRGCHHQFEDLVRPGDVPACPACGSQDLERRLSLFAAKSEDRSRSAFKTARAKAAKAQGEANREDYEHALREHAEHEHGDH
jgi:putative FmdB family regulatory protein